MAHRLSFNITRRFFSTNSLQITIQIILGCSSLYLQTFSWHALCPVCFSAFPLCIPVMQGVGRMGCLFQEGADPHSPHLDAVDTTRAVRSVPGVQGGSKLHMAPPNRQQRWGMEAAFGIKMQYFSKGTSQKCLCMYSCNETSRYTGWELCAAVGFLPSTL